MGPFTLIRLIAQGGMGSVFLALRPVEGETTDEVCVVKTVRTDLKDDREAVGRFLDEARVVQKLDHPAICHTLDAGHIDKSYYLALEFISGRNLRDIHTRAQKLGKLVPDHVVFHAVSEVLAALEYAHALRDPATGKALGIVHRDVSPHNVMLGFDGHVKLIDFGLAAHVLKKELTRPGIMVGKLRYNAPEQVRDRALDGRSDLYSVGVMLYELVVNERFYEGLSEEDIWRVAMKGTFRPRLYEKVPSSLKTVLDLALAPNPEDRFASANDMRDALLEVAGSRGLKDARKQSRAFMTEIFAEERQAEREMILQATGLAEARTRLFQAPSEASMSVDEVSVSSVGRTKVVSPAEVRGRLADLVSGFDPNAETQMPQAPIEDLIAAVDAERAARDPNVFADGPGDATLPATSNSRRDTVQKLRELDDDDAADQTMPASPKSRSSMPRVRDENLRSNKHAAAPAGLPETKVSLKRKKPATREEAIVTEPARKRAPSSMASAAGPPAAAASPSNALLLLGGAIVAAIVVLVVVALVAPRFMSDGKKPVTVAEAKPDDSKPDAVKPKSDEPKVDDTAPKAVDAGVAAPVNDAQPKVDDTQPKTDEQATKPKSDEPVSTTTVKSEVKRPKIDKEKLLAEKLEKERAEKLEKERAEKEKAKDQGPPPQKELKTFKDQVDYLKQYCMDRVACAKSTTQSAASIATLNIDETKQLMAELPKCIARCQR